MGEHLGADPPLWIQSLDKRGRPIDSELLDAAQRNWKRVLSYAQRQRQDASRAADIFEAVVHSLANRIQRHPRTAVRVESLDYYLFWAFTRRLNRLLAREPVIEYVGSLDDLASLRGAQDPDWALRIEQELLLKELQGHMSQRMRHIFFLRESGYSWKEISGQLGIGVSNLKVLFGYSMRKVRKRILRRRPVKFKPMSD